MSRFVPQGKIIHDAAYSKELWRRWMGDKPLSAQQEKERLVWLISTGRIGFKAYHRLYMRTKHWRKMSRDRREFDGARCTNCGRRRDENDGLEVHHKVYVFWEENLRDDLVTLCHECHDLVDDYDGLTVKMKKQSLEIDRHMWRGFDG